MSAPHAPIAPESLHVRTYRAEDHPAVRRFFESGRLAGHCLPNDTAVDIDNIEGAYLLDEHSHFWVAEHEGRVIGMVGVVAEDEHTAEVRRLRVDPAMQGRGVA